MLSIGNMYPPHAEGGYELAWASNVASMRSRGFEVRVLTTVHRQPDVDAPDGPDVHRELRWYWRDYEFPPIGKRARVSLERANAATLRRHLAAFDPDVVAWWGMGGMSLSLIEQVRRAGLPALGHVGDDWMVYGPEVDAWIRACRARPRLGRLVGPLVGLPAQLDLGRAACWHFVSRHTRRRARNAGWQLPRTEITPAGVDTRLFRHSPARAWRWRLLYAGRIDPRKGIDTAISALARLPGDAVLEVVGRGEGDHEQQLRAHAKQLGVAARIGWPGMVPRTEMPQRYAAADAILFPARWQEPWGLVPLEAMAVGRPVVATGTGGSGEYLRDGENCLLVPPDDPDRLADAVQRLGDDAALRKRLRAGGHETAATYTDAEFNRALARSAEEAL
jgi:glycogen(starch) synthase